MVVVVVVVLLLLVVVLVVVVVVAVAVAVAHFRQKSPELLDDIFPGCASLRTFRRGYALGCINLSF